MGDSLHLTLVRIFEQAHREVDRTLSQSMVRAYWEAGDALAAAPPPSLESLADSLSRHLGQVINPTLLQRLRFFRAEFPAGPPDEGLSWSHYVLLMHEPDPKARAFYQDLALQGRWSARELERQMLERRFRVGDRGFQPEIALPGMASRDATAAEFLGLSTASSAPATFRERLGEALRVAVATLEEELFSAGRKDVEAAGEAIRVAGWFFHRRLRCAVFVLVKDHGVDEARLRLLRRRFDKEGRLNGEHRSVGYLFGWGARKGGTERLQGRLFLPGKLTATERKAYQRHLPKVEDVLSMASSFVDTSAGPPPGRRAQETETEGEEDGEAAYLRASVQRNPLQILQ